MWYFLSVLCVKSYFTHTNLLVNSFYTFRYFSHVSRHIFIYLKFQQEICKDIVFKIKLYICKHSDLRNFLVFHPQILTLVILCIKLCVCLNYYCLDYLNKYMIFVMFFFLFVIFQSWIPWCLIPKYIFIDFFCVSLRFCSNLNLIIFQSFSI